MAQISLQLATPPPSESGGLPEAGGASLLLLLLLPPPPPPPKDAISSEMSFVGECRARSLAHSQILSTEKERRRR